MSDSGDNIEMARIAEQAERYEDMAKVGALVCMGDMGTRPRC